MRAWLVIPSAVLVAGGLLAATAGPAWAEDGYGQNSYSRAQASGGELSVQAGVTRWTPPQGSTWAQATQPDPPSGKVNPNQPYGCTYDAGGPLATALLGVGGPEPGQWVLRNCTGPGVINPMPPVWVTGAVPVAGVVPVAPVLVAEQAAKTLALSSPVIEMAPPEPSSQLVDAATWLWVSPASWHPLVAVATAGGVTTTAVATPTKVVWDMGDGASVTCVGPGEPYDPSSPDASTDCSYTWSSAGTYRVTATIEWSVTWSASGTAGGGTLGVEGGPAGAVSVEVVQSEAINTAVFGGS